MLLCLLSSELKLKYFQLFLIFPGVFSLDFSVLVIQVSMNFCCCRFNLN